MNDNLVDLGLSAFFTQQLSLEELESQQLARVTEVQRTGITVSNGENEWVISLGGAWFRGPAEERPTVGDWVYTDEPHEKIIRLLERKSVFKRIATGSRVDVQLIAANIDTLFIVSSCNQDFNESRLERYLALAHEAGVDPVVVLTKVDLVEQSDEYRTRLRTIQADLPIEIVNARDTDSLQSLKAWITPGTTVALVGSSGVGKSTIVNSLSKENKTKTGSIREDDAKGRHTTSARSLHQLPDGGLLLDVPGMRELKVAELDDSLSEVFDDIEELVSQCRFSNCAHDRDPGCAVQAAIRDGELDTRRLANYQKLVSEESRHNASLADRRSKARKFTQTVKKHVDLKKRHKKS